MILDVCDKLFAQVRAETSLAGVCYALQPLFDQYDMISIELNRSNVFWRARFTEKEPWPTVAQMSYPPVQHARRGRLNDEKSPCLYAAMQEETALHEIGAREGDFVQLAGFRAKLETPIRIAVIGELLPVHRTGYLRLTGLDPDGSISRFLNGKGFEEGRRLVYVDAFLANLLADMSAKAQDYIRSRAIAAMIYRDCKIDGIIYPSVQHDLGMNIALRREATDSKIHPVCCSHIRIKRVREFGFVEYDVIRQALRVTPDNKFVWSCPMSTDRRHFFNLTKDEYDIAVQNPDDPNALIKAMSIYNSEK